VLSALFLLSLLLHAHALPDVKKAAVRHKLASSGSSLLETKSTQKVNQRTKYYPGLQRQDFEQPDPQPASQSVPPQQNDRFEQTHDQSQAQTQVQAQTQAQARAAPAAGTPPPGSNGRVTGAAGRISNSDSSCVACQFFVQTMVNSMTKFGSLFASMPSPTSQGSVTSFPPYYNPSAFHPPLGPYMGGYGNAIMNPMARIGMGMIEQDSKLTTKKTQPSSLVEESELPQPDDKGTPPQYGTPRRYRSGDMTYWRDRLNRIDTINPPNPDPMREQARYLESQMFQATYQSFEGLCSSRVPELFIPYCQPMLDKFHIISEGLHYGDRPDQICMRNDFCPQDSYVRKLPHAVFNPHNPV
jgi:hypothetical protein